MNSETNEPSNYSSKSKSLSLGRQGQLSVQVWFRVLVLIFMSYISNLVPEFRVLKELFRNKNEFRVTGAEVTE